MPHFEPHFPIGSGRNHRSNGFSFSMFSQFSQRLCRTSFSRIEWENFDPFLPTSLSYPFLLHGTDFIAITIHGFADYLSGRLVRSGFGGSLALQFYFSQPEFAHTDS